MKFNSWILVPEEIRKKLNELLRPKELEDNDDSEGNDKLDIETAIIGLGLETN